MSNNQKSEIKEVGVFTPKMTKVDVLGAGDGGYVISNIKDTTEIKIGDSVLMLNDEYPDFGANSPASVGGSPVAFRIEVPDADAAFDRAVKAGATVVRPLQDEFYGDRMGMVACPFGYRWSLAMTKEQVSPAEMQKRWTKMLEGAKA